MGRASVRILAVQKACSYSPFKENAFASTFNESIARSLVRLALKVSACSVGKEPCRASTISVTNLESSTSKYERTLYNSVSVFLILSESSEDKSGIAAVLGEVDNAAAKDSRDSADIARIFCKAGSCSGGIVNPGKSRSLLIIYTTYQALQSIFY